MSDIFAIVEKISISESYLKSLQGHQKATDILWNRYALSCLCGVDDMHCKDDWTELNDKTIALRKEIFKALLQLGCDEREVLWQLYIEGKEEDEVAMHLGISMHQVETRRIKGLWELPVPAKDYKTIQRRRNDE